MQARQDLIQRTFEALEGATRAIVHVYNSTSPCSASGYSEPDRGGVTAIARQGAEWVGGGGRYPDTHWTFQYSPESFTATGPDYAVEVCEAVMDVWQPTPGAALHHQSAGNRGGGSSPNCFADQVEYFATHVSRRDAVILSVHTHNDRGGAVAAAELARLAGADRVEGTLLGNGERTGNMDIVTLAAEPLQPGH